MARIRTIKPDFWEDEKIGLLSHGARLLFLGCLNLSDDEGLLRWNEMFLGSSIFPYDDIKAETIKKWMSELEQQEIVFPYMAGQAKQRLGWIVNFHKHQRIDKPQPSKFAPPSLQNPKVQLQYFKRCGGTCVLCGEAVELHGDVNSVGSKVLSLDHIKPRVKGGTDHPSNIRATHLSCNKARGCKDDSELNIYSENGSAYSENDSKNDSENNSTPEWKGKEEEGKGNGKRKGKEAAIADPRFDKKLILENPFSEKFIEEVWINWKEYKRKEHKFLFKSVESEQAALNELVTLSEGNEDTACEIVMQSLAKGWKGFFPLKTEANGHSKTSRQPAGAKINGPKLDTLFNERYGKGGR